MNKESLLLTFKNLFIIDTLPRGEAYEINASLIGFIRSTFEGKKVAIYHVSSSKCREIPILLPIKI